MNNWGRRINKKCYENWTNSAFECYEIGCNCSKCNLPDNLETINGFNCSMKYVVRELVRKYGVCERVPLCDNGAQGFEDND